MKQLVLIAIAIVTFSSCVKQSTCTCTIYGQNKHEIVGINEAECDAYEAKLAGRECSFEN
jgi:hypothetical protein